MAVLHDLISHHSRSAFALAMQLLDCRADAEDVIQDSIHSVLRQAKTPRDSRQFKPWFFTIVRNKVIDLHRARQRRPSSAFNEQLLFDAGAESANNEGAGQLSAEVSSRMRNTSPDQQLEQSQTRRQVQQVLDRLTVEQQEIILLKDWHGFSYSEISQILSIEPGTVMSRLHRARLAFKKIYQE